MKSKKSSTLTLIAFGWNRQAIILVVSRPNEFVIHFCLLRLKRSHRPHVFAHVFKSSWSILSAIPLWIMCRARNDINTFLSLLLKTNLVKFPRISWVGRPLFAILVRLLVVGAAFRFVVVPNRIKKKTNIYLFFSFIFCSLTQVVYPWYWSLAIHGVQSPIRCAITRAYPDSNRGYW